MSSGGNACQVWRNVRSAAAAVSPHAARLAVLCLYLGSAVWRAPPDGGGPPSSAVARLAFMLAAALLYAGRPRSTTGPHAFLCELFMTILICNLALSLLWDPLERGVFAIVVPLESLIYRTSGVELGAENLQLAVTLLLATIFLIWASISVASVNRLIKKVRRIFCLDLLAVRFSKLVDVRKIVPNSHSTVEANPESIHAPSGGDRNPLVDPPANQIRAPDQ